MNGLPNELLKQMLLNLDPMDRMNCAATCRLWADAVASSSMLEDIKVVINGISFHEAVPSLMQSKREYTKLEIRRANLTELDSCFWTKMCKNLRKLVLDQCLWTDEVFYSILVQCTEVESFEFGDFALIDSVSFELPEEIPLQELRDKLRKARHLKLRVPMSESTLDIFLKLMPELTSLSLDEIPGEGDFAFRSLVPCFTRAEQRFTKLSFCIENVEDQTMKGLIESYAECLQELRLVPCFEYYETLNAIQDCTRLRRLHLGQCAILQDPKLERIILNNPDLEVLVCDNSHQLEKIGLREIHRLRKLRHLCLSFAKRIPSSSLCNIGRLPNLQHLDLRKTHSDLRFFQSIACLRELRVLKVGSTDFTSDCFSIIVENFEKLETLFFSKSDMLSDEDGIKLHLLRNLKDLRFAPGPATTDRTFEDGLGSPYMMRLHLTGCALTDFGLEKIAEHHGHLRELTLFKCNQITDAGIAVLLRRQPYLRKLVLMSNRFLTENSIRILLDVCPRLKELEVRCMSDGMNFMLRDKRPQLDLREAHRRPRYL
ncbi:uncharacterized protein LOC100897607 [Galendromus occidentalis]|uniref:Uncharacterized protein LOC100897607 n=1 Tax=Galendromus occidentalis TaxID=34638 RepID=A0AAJ6QX02_9ACAR|nr:uncharacterized protein LOC100897607 [Galendromus occidentalis]